MLKKVIDETFRGPGKTQGDAGCEIQRSPPDDTIITKIQGELNAEYKQRFRSAV